MTTLCVYICTACYKIMQLHGLHFDTVTYCLLASFVYVICNSFTLLLTKCTLYNVPFLLLWNVFEIVSQCRNKPWIYWGFGCNQLYVYAVKFRNGFWKFYFFFNLAVICKAPIVCFYYRVQITTFTTKLSILRV